MGLMRLWFASIMTSCDLGCEMIQKYYDDITPFLSCFKTLPLYILSTLGHIKRRVWERKSNMYLSYWDGPCFQTANWHEITYSDDSGGLDTWCLSSPIGQCYESSFSNWLILTSWSCSWTSINPRLMVAEAEETIIVQQLWVLQKCYKSLIPDLNGPDMIIIF